MQMFGSYSWTVGVQVYTSFCLHITFSLPFVGHALHQSQNESKTKQANKQKIHFGHISFPPWTDLSWSGDHSLLNYFILVIPVFTCFYRSQCLGQKEGNCLFSAFLSWIVHWLCLFFTPTSRTDRLLYLNVGGTKGSVPACTQPSPLTFLPPLLYGCPKEPFHRERSVIKDPVWWSFDSFLCLSGPGGSSWWPIGQRHVLGCVAALWILSWGTNVICLQSRSVWSAPLQETPRPFLLFFLFFFQMSEGFDMDMNRWESEI